mgnify:CR=1 FL=1
MAIKDLRDNLKRLKDSDPVELASQLNHWLQESGETLRLRIEDEVEKAVTKRGFVKRSDFAKLEARIVALEGKRSTTSSTKTRTKGRAKAQTASHGVSKSLTKSSRKVK